MYFSNQISRRHFNKVLCFKKFELRNSLVYSWTEEPGRLQSMGPQSWIRLSDFTYSGSNEMGFPDGSRDLGSIPGSGRFPWRRKWQPTLVCLPGKSHGQRSLAGCSPWGYRVRHDWACMQWNGNKTILSCHLVAVRQKKKKPRQVKGPPRPLHPSQPDFWGEKRGLFVSQSLWGFKWRVKVLN